MKIWHCKEDGSDELVKEYRIVGNYVEFLAYSFSVYVIVDESSESTYHPLDNCTCNCHKSGISNFFWKIINFFHKIFGMNQYRYCACGKPHW